MGRSTTISPWDGLQYQRARNVRYSLPVPESELTSVTQNKRSDFTMSRDRFWL